MRALVLLVCVWVSCLAQVPQKCTSPPLLSGSLSVSSASEKLMVYANYIYDALFQRVYLREIGVFNNHTFHMHVLLLFKENVMYKIDEKNRTCCKKTLKADFHPLSIPEDASLLGQVVLGSTSEPGQGVLVNTWAGNVTLHKGTGKYLSTVTQFGCVPVSTLFYSDKTGWMVTSFFNNVIGVVNPQHLNPPDFCKNARLEEEDGEEPLTFYSLF